MELKPDKLAIDKTGAVLVIVDMQEKLCKPLDPEWLNTATHKIGLLALFARHECIPVVVTEQYPEGLGPVHPDILAALDGTEHSRFSKTAFSCVDDGKLWAKFAGEFRGKKIILTGMETHICVYLTALGLVQSGFDVFVARDATIARDRDLHANGLYLAAKAGAVVSNAETLVFQMMGCSGGATFKAVSAALKKLSFRHL